MTILGKSIVLMFIVCIGVIKLARFSIEAIAKKVNDKVSSKARA